MSNKIEEIKKRHAEATPGPWEFKLSHNEYGLYGNDKILLSFGGCVGYEWFNGLEPELEDEVFIQNSWSDIAYLLSEYDRLRAALEKIKDYEVGDDDGFDEIDIVNAFGEVKEIAEQALTPLSGCR